jgi:hypothetical protein
MVELDAGAQIEDGLKFLITQKFIILNGRVHQLRKTRGYEWNKNAIEQFGKELCELIRLASFNEKIREETVEFIHDYPIFMSSKRSYQEKAGITRIAWDELSDLLRNYGLISIKSKD